MCAKICLSADLLMTMSGQDLSDFPHGTSERALGSYSCNRAGKKCLQPLTFIIMSQMKRREHQKLAVLLKSQGESP